MNTDFDAPTIIEVIAEELARMSGGTIRSQEPQARRLLERAFEAIEMRSQRTATLADASLQRALKHN
jgi:hypothetical protein